MKTKKILLLVAVILICQSAGIIGSLFTAQEIPTWYNSLQKPTFTPPGWLFGPVWITLYTLMGISLYLIWNSKKAKTTRNIFLIHLIFNASWSIIFFGLHQIFLALLNIILIWLIIILLIHLFNKINKKAAYLLIPYFLWVTFAGILNLSLFLLN